MNKFNCFLRKNSSVILTGASIFGIVLTSVLAAKATPKAIELLKDAENKKGAPLNNIEKIKYGYKPYIYTGLSGLSTILCIFGLNYISDKKQKSIISAYGVLQNTYLQYRENIKKISGDETDKIAMSDIIRSKYNSNLDLPEDGEDELFFDYESMRYFYSTTHRVMRAECEAMKLIEEQGYLILNQWYDLIGLPRTQYGYTLGWQNVDSNDPFDVDKLEFIFDTVYVGDNKDVKCTIITSNIPVTFDYIWNN